MTQRLRCHVTHGMFSDERVISFKHRSYVVHADKADECRMSVWVEVLEHKTEAGLWAKLPTIEYPVIIPIEQSDLMDVEVPC